MSSLFRKARNPRLRVTLPNHWHDLSQANLGKPTYSRTGDPEGALLEVTILSTWRGGKRPDTSAQNLLKSLEERFKPLSVKRSESGEVEDEPWVKTWATVLCDQPGCAHFQCWYLSDGQDLLMASYISGASPSAQELAEARAIAFRLALTG